MNAVTAERRKPVPDPIAADVLRCSHCKRLRHEHAQVDTPDGPEYFCPDPAGEAQRLALVRALQDAAATSSGTADQPPPAEEEQQAEPEPSAVDIAEGDTAPAEPDESPLDTRRAEIPQQAVDTFASFDRTLAAAEPQHRALIFMRASVEIMRLVDRDSAPAAWSQIVDDLDAMGRRHEIDPVAAQNLMAAATDASPDRRAGEPQDGQQPDAVDITSRDHYPESADGEPDHSPAPAAPLALVRPQAWRGVPVPPMRWLATRRIPAADATILSGDGGCGKTTVALQLAVAVERNLGDWLGTICEAGPVILFSGEEPQDEMRRRLEYVTRSRGLEPEDCENLYFHFADPDACLLGIARPNGPIVATPLFESLRTRTLEIRPVLIVVDSIAATFGGNQNDRVHARSFVGLFRRLAREADCAILLLDHPSLSGLTSGTGRGGSMDWQNATRARLHLETVDDQDGAERVLEVKKINYGKPGEKVKLRWQDGCFVMQGDTPAPARAAAEAIADQTYLDCLDVATVQGRNIFEATGRGYAPAVFAAMPEAKGITARAFAAAQERLLSAGLIWNEAYGPPSRNSRRLARKVAKQISEAAE